jgi:hypothetical protein
MILIVDSFVVWLHNFDQGPFKSIAYIVVRVSVDLHLAFENDIDDDLSRGMIFDLECTLTDTYNVAQV